MPAFKNEFSAGLAEELAALLAAAWPAFPRRRFTAGVAAALVPLELMARVDHLAGRLVETLPAAFPVATEVLWRALAIEKPALTGWMMLPCGYYVARAGLDSPDLALPLLAGLTPRFSSEGPIRPFIERHPDLTYDHLHRWTADPDEHVRRLVSEGTRPRLPWAPQLRGLIADPSPNLPLLDRLVDDPSPYVRRSVANHLNDISKDHPDVSLRLAEAWLGRGEGAAGVVRHGLRTMVKRGDARALALLGVDSDADIALDDLGVSPERVTIGESVTVTFTLTCTSDRASTDAVVDYRVHYVGAKGTKRPKVFKLTRLRLAPGVPVTVSRRHSFAHVSIRHIRPGLHTVDIQVNGRVLGSVTVDVVDPL